MNLNVFSATYTDSIKFDEKPNEDFYLISDKHPIFVLADGVTQAHWPSGEYAFPSYARAVAEIFCHTVLKFLEGQFESENLDSENNNHRVREIIVRAFDLANKQIGELNRCKGIVAKLDYLVHDYFDTVGITGLLLGNTLFYGYVGDCGLAIFNKENQLRFQAYDQAAAAQKKVRERYPNFESMSQDQQTIIMHKEFRNSIAGEGYGSFSGEEGVKKYYIIDGIDLSRGDLVVFYSDGFASYLSSPEFINILRCRDKKALDDFTSQKAKEDYQKFGTDRTVLSINY